MREDGEPDKMIFPRFSDPRPVAEVARADCPSYAELRRMAPKSNPDKAAHLNIRDIPRSTLYRLKMAAAAEEKTVKDLVLELVNGKIQELERKGLLPKGKN